MMLLFKINNCKPDFTVKLRLSKLTHKLHLESEIKCLANVGTILQQQKKPPNCLFWAYETECRALRMHSIWKLNKGECVLVYLWPVL